MSIDIQCPGCGERLRVADHSAGKNAKCPKCQAVFPVSATGAAEASPSPALGPEPRRAEPVATPAPPPGAPTWRMKTPTGETYGPVSRQELDSWVAEGRISADCQVLAEGSDQWQWARDVLPALAGGGAAGAGVNVNPYSSPSFSPSVSMGGRSRHARPHRGGMILAFGIIGITGLCVTGIGGIFGPIAWVMGHSDLKEMRMGRMDRSGEGSTQAGMICGMITTIMMVLGILLVMLLVCGSAGGL